MPYKNEDKAREAARLRKQEQRRRDNVNVTPTNVTPCDTDNVTLTRPNRLGDNGLPEMVKNEYNPDELLKDGTKRYLGPFHDGQVHDSTVEVK